MVSNRTLAIVSTIAVSTSAIFAIAAFAQASQVAGALDAISEAIDNGEIRQALSILFNPQQVVSDFEVTDESTEIDEPSFFDRIYGGG